MIFSSPEEIERMHAESDATRHEFTRFLGELDDDGLRMIETMLDSLAVTPHPARIAAFFSGKIGQIREMKFNICAACGKNHDKDLAELVGDGQKKDMPDVPEHIQARRRLEEAAEDGDVQPIGTAIGSTGPMTENELTIMAMYKLDDLRMEDTKELLGFVCLGCGMKYPSIQARIQKEPGVEGCFGCQEKAKFG